MPELINANYNSVILINLSLASTRLSDDTVSVTCSCRHTRNFLTLTFLFYRCGSKTGGPNGVNRKRSVLRDTHTILTSVQEELRPLRPSWRPPCRTLSRISASASGNLSKVRVLQVWQLPSVWVEGTLHCRRAPYCRGATSAITQHHRPIFRATTTEGRHLHFFLQVLVTSHTTPRQQPARFRVSLLISRQYNAPSCRVRAPLETTTSTQLHYWPQRPPQPWRHRAAPCPQQWPRVQRQTSTDGVRALRLYG